MAYEGLLFREAAQSVAEASHRVVESGGVSCMLIVPDPTYKPIPATQTRPARGEDRRIFWVEPPLGRASRVELHALIGTQHDATRARQRIHGLAEQPAPPLGGRMHVEAAPLASRHGHWSREHQQRRLAPAPRERGLTHQLPSAPVAVGQPPPPTAAATVAGGKHFHRSEIARHQHLRQGREQGRGGGAGGARGRGS